jgi:alpha-galactosidase
MSRYFLLTFVLLGFLSGASAQAPGALAATPPMGWNSWDSFGTTVREDQVKAIADVMARDLAQYGWKYVVVDIQWYAPGAEGHDYKPGAPLVMDEYGRLMPAVNRFPSAANGAGFKPLADYVHAKGLKFGIHIMRGIPRQAAEKNLPIKGTSYNAADIADRENSCRWNPDMWGVDTTCPGSQEYYNSLLELYASWGVDFIKADDMGSHLYQPAEMKALHRAIEKSGRPIVLSISPGPAPVSEVEFFQRNAQMWRISDDFWDDWKLLRQQFEYTREWAPYIGQNGTWPDADMLPIGPLRVTDKEGKGSPTKFTENEQRTMMTLWCIFRSPLIIGGDLRRFDDFTRSLVTNPEVLAVNQSSSNNHVAYWSPNTVVWTADVPESADKYVALFNISDSAQDVSLSWEQVGVKTSDAAVRDLWQRKDVGIKAKLEASPAAHGSVLFRISPRTLDQSQSPVAKPDLAAKR